MKVYFPDTNFFFDCRRAGDLPWHELEGVKGGQASDVRLIVPSAVVTEIERHKAKGNSRAAKRARDASALLRGALEAAGQI
jgi:rRNA-processing protein FCF1